MVSSRQEVGNRELQTKPGTKEERLFIEIKHNTARARGEGTEGYVFPWIYFRIEVSWVLADELASLISRVLST